MAPACVWCVGGDVWCVVRGAWGVWRGVWCVVCGVLCVVCGVWCVVCGVWCVMCGVRCAVCGVCDSCLTPGSHDPVLQNTEAPFPFRHDRSCPAAVAAAAAQ